MYSDAKMKTCICIYILTNIHIQSYILTYNNKRMHTIIHTCIEFTYTDENMHIYIHTYKHKIHTYTYVNL